jgi:hypothetical protein
VLYLNLSTPDLPGDPGYHPPNDGGAPHPPKVAGDTSSSGSVDINGGGTSSGSTDVNGGSSGSSDSGGGGGDSGSGN